MFLWLLGWIRDIFSCCTKKRGLEVGNSAAPFIVVMGLTNLFNNSVYKIFWNWRCVEYGVRKAQLVMVLESYFSSQLLTRRLNSLLDVHGPSTTSDTACVALGWSFLIKVCLLPLSFLLKRI